MNKKKDPRVRITGSVDGEKSAINNINNRLISIRSSSVIGYINNKKNAQIERFFVGIFYYPY